jgi:SAM-dependent methyltransferase
MDSKTIRAVSKAVLPLEVRNRLRALQRRFRLHWIRVGTVDFGKLRRLSPVSDVFGLDRGLPIDRYYTEKFLSAQHSDIQKRVLEVGESLYTRKFGGGRVAQSDVLHVVEGNKNATIVADLTCADHIPSDTYDCIILTFTLQMIYDFRAALRHLYRILKPGGVLLVTSNGISRIGRREGVDPWAEYWHFTTESVRRLFRENFPAANIEVGSYGNVLAAIASLHGLVAEDLSREELDYFDPDFEVLVTVRAVKPEVMLLQRLNNCKKWAS